MPTFETTMQWPSSTPSMEVLPSGDAMVEVDGCVFTLPKGEVDAMQSPVGVNQLRERLMDRMAFSPARHMYGCE